MHALRVGVRVRVRVRVRAWVRVRVRVRVSSDHACTLHLAPAALTLHLHCIHAAPMTLARCSTDAAVTLRAIDWEALGFDPALARIEQPAIAKLQPARPAFAGANASAHPLAIRAGQGVVLVVRGAHGRT